MTRALFLTEPGAELGSPGDTFVLGGEEGRHAGAVRRIRAGEWISIGNGAGSVASCEVLSASKSGLSVRISELAQHPQPGVLLTLVQALAKGGRDEQAVETATEAGVDRIIPWQASRSVVRWDNLDRPRAEKAHARWESTAREAAKQSRRPWIPTVSALHSTSALAARIAESSAALILHESAARPISAVPLPPSGEILIVVGPEGGIADDEVALLEESGATTVRLGPEVLRASTAGPLALAHLSSQLGRWT